MKAQRIARKFLYRNIANLMKLVVNLPASFLCDSNNDHKILGSLNQPDTMFMSTISKHIDQRMFSHQIPCVGCYVFFIYQTY